MVKISDVASHAGVSPSTVSYVLSGKRSISAETRRRVMDSIDVLGYRPHAGARALASNRSNVLALVLPLRSGMHVPLLMQFAVAVVTEARRYDHDVLLLTQAEGVAGLRRVTDGALVDGIIAMDIETHDERLPVLRDLDRPSVLIGFPAKPEGLVCVDLDFAAAGALCVDHLAQLGHRRIALLGEPPEVYRRGTGYAERTVDGFRDAARRHGLDVAEVVPCESSAVAVRESVGALLGRHPELSAVVVHNEPAVGPLLAALRAHGRRVPRDVSVVAIGDDETAARAEPPLTSVAVPAEQLGQRAVSLLVDLLDRRAVSTSTMIPPTMNRRASTRRQAPAGR